MNNDTLSMIDNIKLDLDARTKEIIDQLLARMPADGRIDVVMHDVPRPELRDSAANDACRYRFRTQLENEIFCRGTASLLELLKTYDYEITSTAIVMALPNSRVSGGSANNQRSYINERHLTEYYTDVRNVNVIVLVPKGMINFCFEEKVEL
jgi:hypothetical protein